MDEPFLSPLPHRGWPFTNPAGYRRIYWTDQLRDRMKEMWDDPDVTVDEIADLFEVAPATIRSNAWRWRYGKKAGGRKRRGGRGMSIVEYEGPARTPPAIDPRARDVVKVRQDGVNFVLHLSCGHVVTRKIMIGAVLKKAICGSCPAVGGIAQVPAPAGAEERPFRQFGPRRRPATWFDWSDENVELLKVLWADNSITIVDIVRQMGARSRNVIIGKAHALKLPHRKTGKRATGVSPAGGGRLPRSDGHQRRFVGATGRRHRTRISPEGRAAKEGLTIFQKRVVDANLTKHILVEGVNNRKIGRAVKKGIWKGMPIFTLTLQERKTCPSTCPQWLSCYGNSMNWAIRIREDGDFAIHLTSELLRLQARFPGGFVVRLHVLGDFFSLEYVNFWRLALDELPALHVFGFTAWPLDTPIGGALWDIVRDRWDRFAIRFSNRGSLIAASEVVEEEADAQGIICPAEKDENRSCGTCGMCWASKKGARLVPAVPLISFPRH